MAFKEVQDLSCDVATALGGKDKKTGKSNPTQVEGYFLGSKQTETGKLHILRTPKGTVGVWGKTDLDRKLLAISPGTMIRATHTGMLKVPGKNDMYKYKVEVDSENTIEVADSSPSQESQSDESYIASDEGSPESDLFSDESSLDEVTPAYVSAPKVTTASNLAKAQALLNSKRR